MSDDRGLTRDEARRRAVEAAALALIRHDNGPEHGWDDVSTQEAWAAMEAAEAAFTNAERAMADAGWRMARDVSVVEPPPIGPWLEGANQAATWDEGWRHGYDACRRAMLGDE